MAKICINKDTCVKCGACVDVCPLRILRQEDAGVVPVVIPEREPSCIACGHCVCVCPASSVSTDTIDPAKCQPLPRDWRMGIDKAGALLKGRRSVRAYKDEPVTSRTIERLIDIARYAPSGINRQPVYWAIIDKKEDVRELARLTVEWMKEAMANEPGLAAAFRFDNIIKAWENGNDRVLRGAPAAVLAYSLKDDPTAPQASAIALTYLEIAAASAGLGACWAGYAAMAVNKYDPARKFIGLSMRTACHGIMMLGYQKHEYKRIPPRNSPRIKRINDKNSP